jgi:CBS domain-containing protein
MDMLQSVNLRDYMLLNPVKVREDDNVLEAMQVIIDNKISGVCVIDTEETLVGILSELDCLRAVLSATYNDSGVGRVKDYMASDNLVVAHPNEDIVDVAQDMLLKNKRRRPVVEDGKLVGQITCRQLLTAVKKFQS